MIKLFDGYEVEVDDYAYTLRRYTGKTNKNGKPTYKVIGYYTSLNAALNALSKRIAQEKQKDGCMSLREAVQSIRESNERVEQFIRQEIGEHDGS